MTLPFLFVITTFVIIITMSLLAMLLPKNMIANGAPSHFYGYAQHVLYHVKIR